jgi:hypothetical protein
MDDSMEAGAGPFHLRHDTQNEVAAALHTSETRVSRSILIFQDIDEIPNALRGGGRSEATDELASSVRARRFEPHRHRANPGREKSRSISGSPGPELPSTSPAAGSTPSISPYARI